jgi:hypothetical protein
MSQKTSKSIIVITTLVTALIHLVLLNILLGKIDIPFTLNGLGFLTLLAVFLIQPSFIVNQRTLFTMAYLGFTTITILAWFVLGDLRDTLGIITKIDELLLILALVLHWRAEG